MTKAELKKFYKAYGKAMGIKFYFPCWLHSLLTLATRKIPGKFRELMNPAIDAVECPKTLGKKLVMLSFEPGDQSVPWLRQIEEAVEEAEHTRQIRRYVAKGGTVSGWYRDYFNPKSRGFCAIQEGAAKCAAAEVVFAATGKVPGPPDLSSYLVGTSGQQMANDTYSDNIKKVLKMGRGSSTFESAAVAIRLID